MSAFFNVELEGFLKPSAARSEKKDNIKAISEYKKLIDTNENVSFTVCTITRGGEIQGTLDGGLTGIVRPEDAEVKGIPKDKKRLLGRSIPAAVLMVNEDDTVVLSFVKAHENKLTSCAANAEYGHLVGKDEYVMFTVNSIGNDGTIRGTVPQDINAVVQVTDIQQIKQLPGNRKELLGRSFPAAVIAVDFERNQLKLSINRGRDILRRAVISELQGELNKLEDKGFVWHESYRAKQADIPFRGMFPKIMGRVKHIQENTNIAYIDLGNLDIRGVLKVSEVSNYWVQSITDRLRMHDVVEVAIIGYRPAKGNKTEEFICSLRLAKSIEDEDVFKFFNEGDMVQLKCVRMAPGNWYGESPLHKGHEVYCQYPNEDMAIKIEMGREYGVKIYHVDPAKGIIRGKVRTTIPKS